MVVLFNESGNLQFMNRFIFITGLLVILSSFTAGHAAVQSDSSSSPDTTDVTWITVNGSIDPTTSRFIDRAITQAGERGSQCLIIELDTPGGLLDATKEIVQRMLSSSTPVIVYVSPEGASAGSAGVFITMAAHIAVMAPATNIGAAHPVQMGGQPMDTVMKEKLVNYAESYIESIAERRQRNVEWAKSAVRSSSSITEKEALEKNVVDLLADNQQDLLEQLDGREAAGKTLQTRNAVITTLKRTYSENFLGFLFQPQVMMILMLVAIYGLLGEMSNPGAIFPGMTGAIALILFLYTVSAVPINVAGFALIGLAIILFISETFTPTFGLLTFGGAVSFFMGGLILFEDLTPVFQLSWSFLIIITLLTAAFFAFIVSAGLKAQFLETKAGSEAMIGSEGRALETIGPDNGRIFVDGEYWKARTRGETIEKDQNCEVLERNGLTLIVQSKEQNHNGEPS